MRCATCTTGVSSMDLNMVTSTARTMYATAPHSLRAPWRASQRASHVAHPEQHGVFSPCWGRGDAVRTTRMAARRARRRSPLTCFPAPHRAHSGTFGPQARPTRSAGPLSVQDELRRPPSLRKAWTPPSNRSSRRPSRRTLRCALHSALLRSPPAIERPLHVPLFGACQRVPFILCAPALLAALSLPLPPVAPATPRSPLAHPLRSRDLRR